MHRTQVWFIENRRIRTVLVATGTKQRTFDLFLGHGRSKEVTDELQVREGSVRLVVALVMRTDLHLGTKARQVVHS